MDKAIILDTEGNETLTEFSYAIVNEAGEILALHHYGSAELLLGFYHFNADLCRYGFNIYGFGIWHDKALLDKFVKEQSHGVGFHISRCDSADEDGCEGYCDPYTPKFQKTFAPKGSSWHNLQSDVEINLNKEKFLSFCQRHKIPLLQGNKPSYTLENVVRFIKHNPKHKQAHDSIRDVLDTVEVWKNLHRTA